MRLQIVVAFVALVGLGGCTTTPDPAGSADSTFDWPMVSQTQLRGADLEAAIVTASASPLGSFENPVRAARPSGQRDYLERLRCADGTAPRFQRTGSLGPGVFGSIVDGYRVDCADGYQADVVMDMYHRNHVELGAVPGFTVLAP
ncbi:hypothetical protein [Erythrobacter sp. EC-HK427]|uniref:hypothetical protein n=1 Tax=Erythrobacter sp. EC-HK427 TaxID=2038396 RepID=UPI0012554A41|nr:hypothetical protein [Erythrobacter sp. EC-HK427]VVT02662.1 conserved hypothetical protein [Erythrobacter sp. EC-HK427]